MTITVQGPNGVEVEFPEGTDAATIRRVMLQFSRSAAEPPKEQKQRTWADVPGEAIQNLGPSAAQFAKNVVTPFLEPVETAKALYNVGKGVASKAAGLVVDQDPAQKAETEAAADAVGQFFKDRYGSLDAVRDTLATDPVGAAADAAMVLTGGGAVAARAPGVAGQVGGAVRAAGSAIDPLANVGRAVRATGNAGAAILGQTTGAGAMPVRTAFEAGREAGATLAPRTAEAVQTAVGAPPAVPTLRPEAASSFTDAMRGYAPVGDVIDMAEGAVKNLTRERGDAYRAGIAATKADGTVLNLNPIKDAVDKALKSVTYQDVPIDAGARSALSKVWRTIKRFENIPNNQGSTAAGLDAMKQAVGTILNKQDPRSNSYRVVKQVYDAIGTEIRSQVPSYADTMRGYAQASDQLDELRRTFNVGTGATADTTARKLLSVTRNNVNTNYGERARLFDVMAQQPGAEAMPYAVAGHALSSEMPRGMATLGLTATGLGAAAQQFANPLTLAALPLFSPRIVGEMVYMGGNAVGLVDDLAARMRMSPDALRTALMSGYVTNTVAEPARSPLTDIYDQAAR